MCRAPARPSKQQIQTGAGWTLRAREAERDESGTANAKSRAGRPAADSRPLRSTQARAGLARHRSSGTNWSLRRRAARPDHYFCLLLFFRAGELASDVRAVGTRTAPGTGARFTIERE